MKVQFLRVLGIRAQKPAVLAAADDHLVRARRRGRYTPVRSVRVSVPGEAVELFPTANGHSDTTDTHTDDEGDDTC